METWKTAYNRFKEEIGDNKDYRHILDVESLEILEKYIQQIPILVAGRQSTKVTLPRLQQLLTRLRPFAEFLDAFHFKISPSTLIYGSLRLMLSYGQNNLRVLDEVITIFDENGDIFSHSIPESSWSTSKIIQHIFWDLYTELVCLFARIIDGMRRNRSVLQEAGFKILLSDDYQQTSKRIRRLSKKISIELMLESFNSRKPTLDQQNCYHIPQRRNRRLIGREDELQKVALELNYVGSSNDGNNHSLRSLALYGLGGVGKTQIALEYAYRGKELFDAVFWITADNMIDMKQAYFEIAQKLGLIPENKANNDANTMKNDPLKMVNNWLATTSCKWLLVFDNADDAKLARQAWPNATSGSILLTSRDRTVGHNPALKALKIEPFNTEIGAQAFLAMTDRDTGSNFNQSCAMEITKVIGGLPLALEQMSCYVTVHEVPLEEFVGLYKREKEKLHKKRSEFSDYPHSLHTVFHISTGNLSSKASDLQNLLAFFHPDGIENSLVRGAAYTLESRVEIQKYAWLADELDFIDAKTILSRASLIDWQLESTSLSLHRIVQEVTMTRMTVLERNTFFSLAITILHASFPDFENKPGHSFQKWSQCHKSLPHIIRLAELKKSKDFSLEPNNPEVFVALLSSCGWFLYEAEHFEEVQKLVDVMSSMVDSSSLSFARARNYEGLIENEINRPRHALRCFSDALKITQNQQDPNERRIISCLNNIGMSYTELRQYNNALAYHSQARELCQKHPDCIDMNYRNTASVYLRMGKIEEAEKLLKQCPSFQNSADEMGLMSKSARFADDVMFMSMIRMQQNQLDEAFKLCSKVLEFRKDKVGNTLRTCSTLYLAACILLEQGDIRSAIKCVDEVVEICRTVSNSQGHRIRAKAKLADLYCRLGDQNRSASLMSEAVAGKEGLIKKLELPENVEFQDLVAWMAV